MSTFKVFEKSLKDGSYIGWPVHGFLYGSRSKVDSFSTYETALPKESDWDYAIEWSPLIEDRLFLLGWEEKAELAYQDDVTRSIWEREVFPNVKVQIGFKYNLSKFKSIWNNIFDDDYWRFINKRSSEFIGPEAVCFMINTLNRIAPNPSVKTKSTPFPRVQWALEELNQGVAEHFGDVPIQDPPDVRHLRMLEVGVNFVNGGIVNVVEDGGRLGQAW